MGVDPKIVRGVIGRAKEVLTDSQFKYFQDHYEYELTKPAMAEKHGVTISAVNRTLRRARIAMRKERYR